MRDIDSLVDTEKWSLKSRFGNDILIVATQLKVFKNKGIDIYNWSDVARNAYNVIKFEDYCEALANLDELFELKRNQQKLKYQKLRQCTSTFCRNPYKIYAYYNVCHRIKKSDDPYQLMYDALDLCEFRIPLEWCFSQEYKSPFDSSFLRDDYNLVNKELYFKSPQKMIQLISSEALPTDLKLEQVQIQYSSTEKIPHSQFVIKSILDKKSICHLPIDEQVKIFNLWTEKHKGYKHQTLKSIIQKVLL